MKTKEKLNIVCRSGRRIKLKEGQKYKQMQSTA